MLFCFGAPRQPAPAPVNVNLATNRHPQNMPSASSAGTDDKGTSHMSSKGTSISLHWGSAYKKKNCLVPADKCQCKKKKSLFRRFRVMLFIFALPVMQVILFCLAIGRDPTGLHLAVVNKEVQWDGPNSMKCPIFDNCTLSMFSCRYLNALPKDTVVLVSV